MKRAMLVVALAALCGSMAWGAAQRGRLSVQSMPPVVVKTEPQSGDAKVDPAVKEIRVTFSKEMANKSWSWSNVDVDSVPESDGDIRYLEDKKTCVMPVKLQSHRTYGIWLNSENFHGFRDTKGRTAIPYLLVFETR
jgi:hypothetical protein